MTEPMTEARLAEIESAHQEHCPADCFWGGAAEPCVLTVLLAEVRRLREQNERLQEAIQYVQT